MKKSIILIICILLLTVSCNSSSKNNKVEKDITVACYYFPGYHTHLPGDLPYTKRYSPEWNEWELVKNAVPRFEGHYQPRVPLWGYQDERDPKVMEQKIEAAVDHGVNVFIFDWYTYESRPFLNRALDEGFLKAKNTNELKFALMWANHDWMDLFPCEIDQPYNVLYSALVTSESFDKIGDSLIEHYFTKSNYWLIDGKAYFSLYEIQKFIESFGSLKATRFEMEKLEQKAIKAGLKGIHWNLVSYGDPILPGGTAPTDTRKIVDELKINSVTSYVWMHHTGMPELVTDYDSVRNQYFKYWEDVKDLYGVPYYPNVSIGWDSSPRTNPEGKWRSDAGYPFAPTIGSDPDKFRVALEMTKQKLLADPDGANIFNINCWNEWTEGSYLEPDTVYGMRFLEALKAVFVNTK